jgi:hypothetical protein
MNQEAIQIGSKVYILARLPYELDKVYFARKEYLLRSSPTTAKEFINATRLSMVWANSMFMKCVYPEDVVKEMKELLCKK